MIQFVPHRKRRVFITKSSQLMLCTEITDFYCDSLTQYVSTLCFKGLVNLPFILGVIFSRTLPTTPCVQFVRTQFQYGSSFFLIGVHFVPLRPSSSVLHFFNIIFSLSIFFLNFLVHFIIFISSTNCVV